MHKQVYPKSLYWGNTVILLSTIDNSDRTNITPISSSWSLSNNIVIGLSLNSKAIENIENCPEVVLNIASDSLSDRIESIAKFTGKTPVHLKKMASVIVVINSLLVDLQSRHLVLLNHLVSKNV